MQLYGNSQRRLRQPALPCGGDAVNLACAAAASTRPRKGALFKTQVLLEWHDNGIFLWMDVFDAKQRSKIMSHIRSRDTVPELSVRRAAHAMGLRFRLHRRDLPGNPDLVFPRYKVALFVHGCYWHQHGCRRASTPKSRQEYWLPKLAANVARDQRSAIALAALGWRTIVVWECEALDAVLLRERLLGLISERL
jgi:DNA mismatch endonuclease (patch repair protein)